MKKMDFETFYEKVQEKDEEKIETEWKKVKDEERMKNIIFFIIIAIIDIPMIFKMVFKVNLYTMHTIVFLIVIDTIIYVILSIIFSKNKRKFNEIFKNLVIEDMLKVFYDDVDYIPKKGMPSQIYNEGKYEEFYDIYDSDDYFEGKIDNKYEIKMAEVITKEEEKDSEGHTTTTTKFHGLFAKIKIDKSIKTKLRIQTNGDYRRKNKLDMDSKEFEKYFDVYVEDEIIGMQLLTHDIMENIVNIQKIIKSKFDIYINENIIYLRINSGEMFEMYSKKGALDKALIEQNYRVLDSVQLLSENIINTIENTEI